MLSVGTEFRKGILFVRLKGELTKDTIDKLNKKVTNIVKENGINQKVLFIGRYGFEQFILSNYKEGFTYKRNKLYSIFSLP